MGAWPGPDSVIRQFYLSILSVLEEAAQLAAAPVVILFLIFQRQIIGNIKMAGLK